MKIKVILTCDSHYTNLKDQETHQTLLLLNSKSTYKDLKNKRNNIEGSGSVWEFGTKELFIKNYFEH